MIAMYHSAALSVLFAITALCALPQNPIPDFYEDCQLGFLGFCQVNTYALELGQNIHYTEPEIQHLDFDVDAHMLAHLNYQNDRLHWLNGITSLISKNALATRNAMARLRRYWLWLHLAMIYPALHVGAVLSIFTLQQCLNHLGNHVGQPPQNLQVEANHMYVLCSQLPDHTPFGHFYNPCRIGLSRFYEVHAHAYLLYQGGLDQDFQTDNLDTLLNVHMLPNLNEDDSLLWLNRMTSQLSKTTAAIHNALTRLRRFMVWLNDAISATPLPEAVLTFPLPAAWLNAALQSNSLLVQCADSLSELVGQPQNIHVIVHGHQQR